MRTAPTVWSWRRLYFSPLLLGIVLVFFFVILVKRAGRQFHYLAVVFVGLAFFFAGRFLLVVVEWLFVRVQHFRIVRRTFAALAEVPVRVDVEGTAAQRSDYDRRYDHKREETEDQNKGREREAEEQPDKHCLPVE